MVKPKTKEEKEEEERKSREDNFNQRRQSADAKWIDAINERIEELEGKVGIPELRRLKQKTKYLWK